MKRYRIYGILGSSGNYKIAVVEVYDTPVNGEIEGTKTTKSISDNLYEILKTRNWLFSEFILDGDIDTATEEEILEGFSRINDFGKAVCTDGRMNLGEQH
ncbi:MAG: hypothetical protein QXP88_03805 [Thermoproteota archaeon]